MSQVGIEPALLPCEGPQTYALDRATTEFGILYIFTWEGSRFGLMIIAVVK
jgi:hypothetical protein